MPTPLQLLQASLLLCTLIAIVADDSCGTEPEWCEVPMPAQSYYGFEPPSDPALWRRAQQAAAGGEHSVLSEGLKHFSQPYDFLDGDTAFKYMHHYTDIFLDREVGFSALTGGAIKVKASRGYWRHDSYDPTTRIPVVMAGYGQWGTSHKGPDGKPITHFLKNRFGGAGLGVDSFTADELLRDWNKYRHKISTKYILVVMLNENWGLLSCAFPGRTAGWGKCKDRPLMNEFLEDENLVMLVVNQHHNTSHPKVISWPRGIPLHWSHTNQIMWDAMHGIAGQSGRGPVATVTPRRALLFSGASSWGPRPTILQCIGEKIDSKDFLQIGKLSRVDYYKAMGTAKFGLALPGLGYDCFRLWELMLLGTIPVIERGIGFDRTLWRLPALIVDDFADVTPSLLRQAYVEAVYRAPDFEYFRLKQSYWADLLFNVSAAGTIDPLLHLHPMEAEDLNFRRPRERYDCGVGSSPGTTGPLCGPGTKRIPAQSCITNATGGYFTGRNRIQKKKGAIRPLKKAQLQDEDLKELARIREADEAAASP